MTIIYSITTFEYLTIRVRTAEITGKYTNGRELEVVKAVVIENKPTSLPAFVSATFFSHKENKILTDHHNNSSSSINYPKPTVHLDGLLNGLLSKKEFNDHCDVVQWPLPIS